MPEPDFSNAFDEMMEASFQTSPKQQAPKQAVKEPDFSNAFDEMMADSWGAPLPVKRSINPTDEIDTRTSKPKQEYAADPGFSPASMKTQFLSGFVDNPRSKLSLYAKARFPDMPKAEREKRYGIVNGEIVFKGDDGYLHPETDNDFMNNASAFVASATP